VELPGPELPFDLSLALAGGRKPRGETVRSASHLLCFGKVLLGHPPAVARLQRIGEPAEMPERERWDTGSDGECVGTVGAGQFEGGESLQRATER
jgi:hypothetical protein